MVSSGGGISPGLAGETADPQSWRGGSERGTIVMSKPIASVMLIRGCLADSGWRIWHIVCAQKVVVFPILWHPVHPQPGRQAVCQWGKRFQEQGSGSLGKGPEEGDPD